MAKKHPYYDPGRILSYNAVYNFLVGARGLGKTYGFKKHVIKKNIQNGDQFIYLRRYRTEMIPAKNTFFADIAHEFPEWDFRVFAGQAQRAHVDTREDKKREWHVMGYFVALSTAQTMKSVAFPKVKTILFDEFIIEKGAFHYLPKEASTFNNFYSTVDRNQDKTRVFFLANSVTIMNPYFLEFNIRPDQMPELSTKDDGFILVHFPDSEAFKRSVSNTRFGRFIAGSDYEEYAVGNQFADAHDKMIGHKPPSAKAQFNLETANGSFSVWYNRSTSEYYVLERLLKDGQKVFTLVPERMDGNKILMTYADKPLAYLRTAFRQGKVIFDKPKSRNAFVELFKR